MGDGDNDAKRAGNGVGMGNNIVGWGGMGTGHVGTATGLAGWDGHDAGPQ